MRRVVAAGSVITVITGIVSTLGNLERVPNYVCRVPGIHAACGALEVGNVAGAKEEQAWQRAKESRDPAALRAYLGTFPTGVYASEASTRLAACRRTQREVWVAEQRKLPLFIPAGSDVFPAEEAARQAALERGKRDAEATCAGFTGEFRVTGAAAEATEWTCRTADDGIGCGFEGSAVCAVEARQLLTDETCR